MPARRTRWPACAPTSGFRRSGCWRSVIPATTFRCCAGPESASRWATRCRKCASRSVSLRRRTTATAWRWRSSGSRSPRRGSRLEMQPAAPTPEYENELRTVLAQRDWSALREFTRRHNQIPDDVYAKDRHFWEVLLHKLTCNRIDLLGLHDDSRAWLKEHGYTTDLGGV